MKFQKKVLENGLTVLFEKRDVDVTTVMLGVRYGSGHDSLEEKGMAHFIEHLCFKGTKKRKTQGEIAFEIERFGGNINAYTGNDFTTYLATLPSRHLRVAMDVIFDIFFNPVFPEDEVKREADVICEELKMCRDNPARHVFDKIEENLYEAPFGMRGAGTEKIVKSMTRGQLLSQHGKVYIPKNSILCVVGNNDFDEIISMAEKFSPAENKGDYSPEMPKIVPRNVVNEEKRPGLEQTNLVLGFHFPHFGDNNFYAGEVFSSILGKGMSCRLFLEVREKRGLVYGIKSDLDNGKDYGYLVIFAGTDPSKVEEVRRVSLEVFSSMKDLTQRELDEAKVQVIGNWKVEGEGSHDTALNLILSEIRGRAEDYYEFEKKVNLVTLEDIKKLASKTEFASFSLGP